MDIETKETQVSILERFFDGFLQERNIRWLLAVGTLILLGSSLLFLSGSWDTYTPTWKYVILLGYTGTIFAAGQWTRHRLGLPRTATVLQALTVLLLPMTFLVLHWVHRADAMVTLNGWSIPLFAANVAFCAFASWRIFEHFLRGVQPTFLVSYLVLATAGALVPGLPVAWAPIVALALWAVFAAGSVKVNRHVFWLVEEHRAPRIFGFFPIAVLGGQFLMLFALHAPQHISLDWIGVGCVLVAVLILLTADAVAKVFQQRTGDLVRPLPWPIIGPLALSLVLCAVGLILSATNVYPHLHAHALVVASALAAVMMMLVARRTGKEAFVWAGLVCVLIAYNFSPAFFRDGVRWLLDQGAQIVKEQRLPIAFYGLTYLPLLAATMYGACRLGRVPPFGRPLRLFASMLACLMLAVAFGHAKALFPVALCMAVAFRLQTILFPNARLAVGAVIAWLIAAGAIVPFAGALGVTLPAHAEVVALTLAIGCLLLAGPYLDRRLAKLTASVSEEDMLDLVDPSRAALVQSCSLPATLLLACYWLSVSVVMPANVTSWLLTALVGGLMAVQAVRWKKSTLAGITLGYVPGLLLIHSIQSGFAFGNIITLMTAVAALQFLASMLLPKVRWDRLQQTFAVPTREASRGWMVIGLIYFYIPLFAVEIIMQAVQGFEVAQFLQPIVTVPWACQVLVVVMAFLAAYRLADTLLAAVACIATFGLVGAGVATMFGVAGWNWLPAAWAFTAVVALPVIEILQRRRLGFAAAGEDPAVNDRLANGRLARIDALLKPLTFASLAMMATIALGSLLAFSLAMRIAGGIALAGLLAFSVLRRSEPIRWPAWIVINWQLIALAAFVCMPQLQTVFDLPNVDLAPMQLQVTLIVAVSLLVWRVLAQHSQGIWHDSVTIHRAFLAVLLFVSLATSLKMKELNQMQAVCAASVFLLMTAGELVRAVHQQREERVWLAATWASAGAVYLAWLGVLVFGHGLSMFVVLGLGLVCWVVGQSVTQHPRLLVLGRPLQQFALVLPMVAVVLGIVHHVRSTPVWLGANSLALLLAAGLYFWRGIARASRGMLILSALILNIALALLWRDLQWSDPQFFMIPIGISILALVQMLRAEIPAKLHDPLRYLGALVILVSPTFHIVGGSWVHLFCLMVASVAVLLVAMGLRVRALMYAGTAFLVADLVAMVVRGSVDNPNVLWIAGSLFGTGVIALAAVCERNREHLVARIHLLSETLKQWD